VSAQIGPLHIKIIGAEETALRLRAAERATINMAPALRKVIADIRRVIRINFESQGRRGGGSWKALDEKYLEWKLSHNRDPRILISRGRLMDSWTKPYSRNKVEIIKNNYMEFSSTIEYAMTQEYGDEERGIPARPYLKFLLSDYDRWVRICQDRIVGALAGARE
jgi:phage gpG-like protein